MFTSKRLKWALALWGAFQLCASPAMAQPVPSGEAGGAVPEVISQSGPAEPALAKTAEPPKPPDDMPAEEGKTPALPDSKAVPSAQEPLPPAELQTGDYEEIAEADAGRTMLIKHFQIEGNKAIPEEELRKLVAPFEGKELTLTQVRAIAKSIDTMYQLKGYYLVRTIVPTQAFANNEVKLRVVEGKIGNVEVQGADDYSADYLKQRFLASMPNGEFRADDFQRTMLLMNELPNLKIKAVFKPGKATGTADVILKVQDQGSFHGGVDYNNYGTRETGEHRVGVTLSASNLITDADEMRLRGVIGFPARRNNFFEAQYIAPIGTDGLTLSASYANGAFSVSQGLGAILDVRGDADIFTVGLAYPLERSLDFSSNVGLAVTHKEIDNNFFGGRLPFSRDHYTAARATYQADFRDANGRSVLQANYTQGLGGTNSNDPLSSRAGAGGTFSKFNLDLARIQTIDRGLYAMLRASGQFATQPLFVAEQFGLGGPDTVRGFQQSELLGDNGYLVSAELRWSPIVDEPDVFQMAFFIDHGGVSLKRRLPGDLPRGSTLTGAGIGFRIGIQENATLRLDLGFPLSPTNNINGSKPAVYAGVQTRF